MNNCNAIDISVLEDQQEAEKVSYKRRSSIFQTRVINFKRCAEEDAESDENLREKLESREEYILDEVKEQGTFNLSQYVESLRKERKLWQERWKERKSQRRNLVKQKARMEEEGQSLDLNLLSDAERVFVASRPNYEHIHKNTKRLTNVASKIIILNQLVQRLNQRFTSKLEEETYNFTRQIIKISEM
ncbi:hypothetical protein KM043_001678 [Ampulex compressa]|nr:hypothetical protein KM043_001678 [Ampulex compressa]